MADNSFFFEAAKLTVPFVFSLVTLYVNYKYRKYMDKKIRRKHLIVSINDEFFDCLNMFNKIDKQFDNLKNGKVIYFSIDIPKSLVDCVQRMTELDTLNSSYYSMYLAYIEIVRNDHRNLIQLLNYAANSSSSINSILLDAIESQMIGLKKNLICKAKKELELLRYFHSGNKLWNDYVYLRVIDQAEKTVKLIKE